LLHSELVLSNVCMYMYASIIFSKTAWVYISLASTLWRQPDKFIWKSSLTFLAVLIYCIHNWDTLFQILNTVLEIRARPIANVSVKNVWRVQIIDHPPVWQAWVSSLGNYLSLNIIDASFYFPFWQEYLLKKTYSAFFHLVYLKTLVVLNCMRIEDLLAK